MNETRPPAEQPDPAARPAPADAEQRVEEIADRFLDQLQAGEAVDRSAVVAAHPELAGLLEKRLAFVENLHRAARKHRSGDSHDALSDTPIAPRASADTLSFPPPASTSSDPAASGQLPERIGRYLIRELLGQGASGAVYRAYDPKFDREVALKVFRSARLAGADFAERFQREARIAAQLRHPHIVPVQDAGEHEGCPYIDMRLVRGETLEVRLKRGPLPLKEAVELVRKLADALDYAHGFSIIHRDVKPANILLDERGQPQLTDFGLARRAGGELSITEDGQILGTPAYMSPEQAGGGSHQADQRTDVYGLGAVLYRLLTGRVPFPADGSETMRDGLAAQVYRIVHTDLVRPRTVNPVIPRNLEMICLKALAKDRQERFTTAADLAEELRRWLQDEPLRIHPPTLWERTRRWARRNRVAARMAVPAALLVAIVGLGSVAWEQYRLRVEARDAAVKTQDALAEVAASHLLEQARQRVRTPTMGRQRETLDLLRRVAEERQRIRKEEVRERLNLEARSLLVEALGVPDLQVESATLEGNTFTDWRVAMHPSGKAMVVATHGGPKRWVRGQPLTYSPDDQDRQLGRPHNYCISYSPGGKYVVFAPSDGGLQVWDEDVSQPLKKRDLADVGVIVALGFEAMGTTLWTCRADGWVQSFTLPNLEALPSAKFRVRLDSPTVAAFNAGTTRLAVGYKDGRVLLYDTTGRELRSLPEGRIDVEALAWSPESDLVAVGTKDGTVELWPVKEGLPSNHFILGAPGVGNIQFTPDGRWLLAGFRVSAKLWDIATGEQVLTGPGPAWGFSQDERCFAVGGTEGVAFCDLLIPQAVRHFRGHRTAIAHLVWSRDNHHLASLDSRFEVRVWSMDRDASLAHLLLPPGGFYAPEAAVALSDDGHHLAYASGGEEGAQALIYELPDWKKLGEWPLKGGFENLACVGGGKFLLVREELDKDRQNVQTVVWELEAGKKPVERGPIRRSEPGDQRRFFSSELTRDGRYYWWHGPRVPADGQRIEVLELANGKAVIKKRALSRAAGIDFLSPDGRYVYIGDSEANMLHDLSDPARPPKPLSDGLTALSPDYRWHVYSRPREGRSTLQILQRRDEESSWLAYELGQFSFSPDSRYLAVWRTEDLSGQITLLDLPALEEEIAAFEKTLPK